MYVRAHLPNSHVRTFISLYCSFPSAPPLLALPLPSPSPPLPPPFPPLPCPFFPSPIVPLLQTNRQGTTRGFSDLNEMIVYYQSAKHGLCSQLLHPIEPAKEEVDNDDDTGMGHCVCVCACVCVCVCVCACVRAACAYLLL